jgi:hypothetical protein
MLLRPGGPLRQGRAPVARRRVGKATRTATPLSFAKDGHGSRRTPTEGGREPRVLLRGQGGLAKVIT